VRVERMRDSSQLRRDCKAGLVIYFVAVISTQRPI
jgi:hypothetical protein